MVDKISVLKGKKPYSADEDIDICWVLDDHGEVLASIPWPIDEEKKIVPFHWLDEFFHNALNSIEYWRAENGYPDLLPIIWAPGRDEVSSALA